MAEPGVIPNLNGFATQPLYPFHRLKHPYPMNSLYRFVSISCFAALCGAAPLNAAEAPGGGKLDVLNMQQIPAGQYEVKLQVGGQEQTVKIAIKGDRAVFLSASTDDLDGLSGRFELIGNGVFMARLAGRNSRMTEWWLFHPDGTATVKEIPDRGEKQTATPIRER